jgi:hypothetical protein
MQIDIKNFVQEKHVLFKARLCSLGELDGKKNHIKISKA